VTAATVFVLGLVALAEPPSTPARAAAPTPRASITAVEVQSAEALKIDGQLNDAVWQQASPITEFRQRDPKEDAEPTFPTEVRVAYDATSIYVAIEARDPEPGKLVGLLTRRDSHSPSDWVRVAIDSFYDRRTAFEFAVNPAGVKQDVYYFNDGNQDYSWDAVWDVAVTRGEKGWRAEFRIPFSQLRFGRAASGPIGMAVTRQIGRLNETSTWPLLAKSRTGYVSQFGDLVGVTLSKAPKRLELVPYTVAQVGTQPNTDGNPLIESPDPAASMGVDLKYALSPGLMLTATVNPDFGQVEADPAIVNLSAFETFFSEKRPFFVEGSGVYQFSMDCNDGNCSGLFYSRRIGRPPQGEPDVPDDGFSAQPAQTTILGAAKISGRIGKFSVGFLDAVTTQETATIASGPARSTQVVEPFANYSVIRARREFANQSTVGFMTTTTNRAKSDVLLLAEQAYTGGVDWDWRLGPKYNITGMVAGSTVRGKAEAIAELQTNNVHSYQRPDAEHVEFDPSRTVLNGYAGNVAFGKIGGERVRFNSYFGYKSPGFEINDLGYLRRADQRMMSNWLQWRHDRPSKYLRSFRINFNQWASWNFDGDNQFYGGNINAHATFPNNWAVGLGVNREGEGFDDRRTRGGPGGLYAPGNSVWWYVETDDRKPVNAGWFMFSYADNQGSRVYELNPSVQIRPTAALSLNLGISYSDNRDQSQWVEQVDAADGPHYVFGRIDQTTVSLTTRVNYTITPTMSIQVYAQPFVSAGDYSGFKELVNGRADRYADRYQPYPYEDNPDFNYQSFRTTNVFRWEFKPGSTLFVVWQQGREDSTESGRFRFGHDFGGLFEIPARNVFLVKMAYWFNY
jgi:hypothetical protein